MPIQLLMPALSPTMEEGKLVKWLVREGGKIQAGDIIAEIETDKAVMEYESVDDGIIGRLLFPDGAEGIKINTPIAVILQDGEAAAAMDGFSATAPVTPAPAAAPAKAPAMAKPVAAAKAT